MPTTAPNIGIVWGWTLGENGWKNEMDRNLRALDTVVQGSVIAVQNFQPVSPSNGDAYIVEPGASGSWSGYDSRIARFHSGTGWEFYTPKAGWRMWLSSTNRYLRFDGTNWLDEQSTAGTPYLLASGETRPIDTTGGIRTSGVERIASNGDGAFAAISASGNASITGFVNTTSVRTSSTERISSGGAGFLTSLTVSGLTSGRIPIAGAGGLLGDDAGLTWASGPLFTVGQNSSTNSRIQINGAASQVKGIRFQSAGSNRWFLGADNTSESGSNAGARFILIAQDDSGNEIDRPIDFGRNTGAQMNFGGTSNRPARFTGGISAWGVTVPTSRPTVNAAATDLATTTALVNQLRTQLIAYGFVQ